jgi:hypothetical protein
MNFAKRGEVVGSYKANTYTLETGPSSLMLTMIAVSSKGKSYLDIESSVRDSIEIKVTERQSRFTELFYDDLLVLRQQESDANDFKDRMYYMNDEEIKESLLAYQEYIIDDIEWDNITKENLGVKEAILLTRHAYRVLKGASSEFNFVWSTRLSINLSSTFAINMSNLYAAIVKYTQDNVTLVVSDFLDTFTSDI